MQLTTDIKNLSIALASLNKAADDMPAAIARVNRGQMIQIQNELDVQLEILRMSYEAPELKPCCA